MMTRSLLTPISVAVSGSWATARMPRPNLVRLMNWSVTTISTIAATKIVICWLSMIVPKTSNTGSGTNMVTAGSAFEPPRHDEDQVLDGERRADRGDQEDQAWRVAFA